jgi:hypothetical protein
MIELLLDRGDIGNVYDPNFDWDDLYNFVEKVGEGEGEEKENEKGEAEGGEEVVEDMRMILTLIGMIFTIL